MEDPSRFIGVCIASVVFLVACLFLFRNDNNNNIRHGHENNSASSLVESTSGDTVEPIATTQTLRNVFSVKQKPTFVAGNGCGTSSSATGDRPFESSYYFAHNKHSTG